MEIEVDSSMVVDLVKGGNVLNHPDEALIMDCRKLIMHPWHTSITRIRRQGNRCVDALVALDHCSNNVI